MLGEVPFELFGHRRGFVFGILGEFGNGHFVAADGIDDLLMRFLDGGDSLAQRGVGPDGLDGIGDGAAGADAMASGGGSASPVSWRAISS
jgi:hypothetical protein